MVVNKNPIAIRNAKLVDLLMDRGLYIETALFRNTAAVDGSGVVDALVETLQDRDPERKLPMLSYTLTMDHTPIFVIHRHNLNASETSRYLVIYNGKAGLGIHYCGANAIPSERKYTTNLMRQDMFDRIVCFVDSSDYATTLVFGLRAALYPDAQLPPPKPKTFDDIEDIAAEEWLAKQYQHILKGGKHVQGAITLLHRWMLDDVVYLGKRYQQVFPYTFGNKLNRKTGTATFTFNTPNGQLVFSWSDKGVELDISRCTRELQRHFGGWMVGTTGGKLTYLERGMVENVSLLESVYGRAFNLNGLRFTGEIDAVPETATFVKTPT